MPLDSFYGDLLYGRATPAVGALAALGALVASFLFSSFVLRPFVRVLSSHEPEKVADARRRRIRFAANSSSFALAAFTFFFSTLTP